MARPQIMKSEMTGRWYIVTAFSKPGVAKTKYDCTEQIEAIIANATPASQTGEVVEAAKKDSERCPNWKDGKREGASCSSPTLCDHYETCVTLTKLK